MKRILLAGAAVLMAASVAFAVSGDGKGQHTIANSRHNIPANLGKVAGNLPSASYQQICIYCHTPHNPRLNVPLWNRNANNNTYTYYNSPSLTSYTKGGQSVTAATVSGFCLSCHDGVSTIGAIQNRADTGIAAGSAIGNSNSGAGNETNAKGNIGTDLSNDHPVGLDYAKAQASLDPDQLAGTEQATNGILLRLWDVATVKKTLGNFLFNTDGSTGDNATQLECASCHKVHDPFNPPFLRVTNNMSHLCLACHNK
jgi:predicted CXXCH cytochrome family protein